MINLSRVGGEELKAIFENRKTYISSIKQDLSKNIQKMFEYLDCFYPTLMSKALQGLVEYYQNMTELLLPYRACDPNPQKSVKIVENDLLWHTENSFVSLLKVCQNDLNLIFKFEGIKRIES